LKRTRRRIIVAVVDNPVAVYFGENLRACRKRAGITQEELGQRASLHRTEIGLLERGVRVPRIDTLIKLASALSIPSADLLVGISWEPDSIQGEGFEFRLPVEADGI
jgi:transcriptional regulator with XRE-family HTH domain